MNNDLKATLTDVLKEALAPVNNEIKKLSDRVGAIETNMVTKQEFDNRLGQLETSTNANFKMLSDKLDNHHYENINSDNLLMNEIRSIREGVIFVNRKIADTELEVNILKQSKQ